MRTGTAGADAANASAGGGGGGGGIVANVTSGDALCTTSSSAGLVLIEW
jgi:hypothetical protein